MCFYNPKHEHSKCPEIGRESAAAAAKSLRLCLILCDPIDSRPPGSSVPGILQARTLEGIYHHLYLRFNYPEFKKLQQQTSLYFCPFREISCVQSL